MRAAGLVLTVMSAVLWSLAGAATWAGLDRNALAIQVGASTAVTVLAGLCWIAHSVRDRDKEALVYAIADFTQRRVTAPTRPEQRLRLVSEARSR